MNKYLTVDELNILIGRMQRQETLRKVQRFLLSAFGVDSARVTVQGRSHLAGERFGWLLLDRIAVTDKAGEVLEPNYALLAWEDCPAIDLLQHPESNPLRDATEVENESYPGEGSTAFIAMDWLNELWEKIVGEGSYYAEEVFDLTIPESQALLAWTMPRLSITPDASQDQQASDTSPSLLVDQIVDIRDTMTDAQGTLRLSPGAENLMIYCYRRGQVRGEPRASLQIGLFQGVLEVLYWDDETGNEGDPKRLVLVE